MSTPNPKQRPRSWPSSRRCLKKTEPSPPVTRAESWTEPRRSSFHRKRSQEAGPPPSRSHDLVRRHGLRSQDHGHRAGARGEALKGAGMKLEQMDLVEVNEAFASQALPSKKSSRSLNEFSTSTAGRSPSVILSRPAARASSRPCSTNSSGVASATAWDRPASAVGRASHSLSRPIEGDGVNRSDRTFAFRSEARLKHRAERSRPR